MEKPIGRLERELMRGAGVLAVLKLLQQRERYGYELAEALSSRTGGVLAMGYSTLYPMLYNLEAKQLVKAYFSFSQEGRRRKYYRLTPKGASRLLAREKQWNRLVDAMSLLGVGPQLNAKGSAV